MTISEALKFINENTGWGRYEPACEINPISLTGFTTDYCTVQYITDSNFKPVKIVFKNTSGISVRSENTPDKNESDDSKLDEYLNSYKIINER